MEETKEKLKHFFIDIFSVEDDKASNTEIKNSIKAGTKLKGTNMCVLVMAIIIASVGLNMNSTAVIIGAMLISPLMGGIIGIGYGFATNDLKFAKKSFVALLIEVVISIITSTIYFMISPISTTSHELLARTSPAIWDVIIALAGGFAGIIGITRKQKSNVIPGVAIATALMPPLCTSGFGFATWQPKYFLGALYLFFINSFFICASTIIGLKLMKIPKKKGIDEKEEKKIHHKLVIAGIITIIPSLLFAYQIVNESILNANIQKFIENEFSFDNVQVVKSEINMQDKKIHVAVIGELIQEEKMLELTNKLKDYQLQEMTLKVIQAGEESGLSQKEIEEIIKKQLKTEVEISKNNLAEEANNTITNLEKLKTELKTQYQAIADIAITTNKTVTPNLTEIPSQTIVTISLKEPLTEEHSQKIEQIIKDKLGVQNILINKTIQTQ